MSSVMDDIAYAAHKFNVDPRDHRHPMFVLDRHVIFYLHEDKNGNRCFNKTADGQLIRSPRRLRDICIYKLTSECHLLQLNAATQLPYNMYPLLLTEAIRLREPEAIQSLVSIWPTKMLRVYDMLPREDYLDDNYLTSPLEGNERTCLIDCFVLGLLKMRAESRLRTIDFTKFEKDRTLCKELCRLPILWMKPSERKVETLYEQISSTLDVSKDKVQRFVNKISVIYSNVDDEIEHQKKIDPVTVSVDLKINVEDVPIGLSLQHSTPFKFACSKLWMRRIPEIGFLPSHISAILDANRITHFEVEDPTLSRNEKKFDSFINAILELRHIIALSLPGSIDTTVNEDMCTRLNEALQKCEYLERINLNYCNLKGRLSDLLSGLRQRLTFLSLKDCRLNEIDGNFITQWHPVEGLRELNLSCNSMPYMDRVIITLISKMYHITCLSVSYCSLSIQSQVNVVRECEESCHHMKVLSMQSYTPLSPNNILQILRFCSQIPSLQKALLFPEAYAFPGNNDQERAWNKYHALRISYRYMIARGREDILLE